jgi:predicted lipoprotein with Yx(FWY)xxD motif
VHDSGQDHTNPHGYTSRFIQGNPVRERVAHMFRRIIRTITVLAALGAGLALSSPAVALARPASGATPDGVTTWNFTHETYPDTSAGLAACNAQGAKAYPDLWACPLGDPDAGVYNLWIGHTTYPVIPPS